MKNLSQAVAARLFTMLCLLLAMPVAWADSQSLSHFQFHELMKRHELEAHARSFENPFDRWRQPSLNQEFWGELVWLRPGQNRSSLTLSIQKIAKGAGANFTFEDIIRCVSTPESLASSDSCKKLLRYHSHRSLFPDKEIVPVALTREGYIGLDGTHDIQASWAANAQYIRMVVTHDLREYSLVQAYTLLEKKGVIYPYDENGEYYLPRYYYELKDDPNRLYAGYQMLSVQLNPMGEIERFKMRGKEDYPLAIKFSTGARRHQELRLGDALRAQGQVFNPSLHEFTSEDFREANRRTLVESRKAHSAILRGVYIVPYKTRKEFIPLGAYRDFHLGVTKDDPGLISCPKLFAKASKHPKR